MAIEQATSKYQAFEGARVLNASTWHQADHGLIGLKQMLDVRQNDLDPGCRPQLSERVEELEASSVPHREARLSIMLGCVVDSVRLKLSFADSELGAASTVTQNVVQLRTPMLVQPCNDVGCLTSKLRRRNSKAVSLNISRSS